MLSSIKISFYIMTALLGSLMTMQHGLVIKSFLSKHFIYSPWFVLLTTFCMIRTNKKQANFISSDTIKELVVNEAEAAVQTSPHPAHLPPQACPSPPQETFSNASPSPLASASHSSEACISSNNSPQPSVQHQEKQAGKQNTNTDANTEEWIVVTEKKKKPVVSCTKKIKINNNKHKSRNMTAKNGNNKNTTPNKRTVSPVQTCLVKDEQDDVPFLSDNESMTESIQSSSSSFSSSDLQNAPKYYSPFSTGFDLFPLSNQKKLPQQPLATNGRLDEYLSSQQAQWTQKQQAYTQRNSILNLLIQSDEVETTITPTCFKYFDDMMMSTSLYPTNDHASFPSINKRDWDSFSR